MSEIYTHPEYLALLETIRTNPRDNAPRLVAADWLLEHGEDDRAEFIRVQYGLQRLGPDPRCHCSAGVKLNPAGCPRGDADRLRVRERILLNSHGRTWDHLDADWVNPIPGAMIGELAKVVIFSRGFVSEVRLPCAAFVGGPCGRCGGNGHIQYQYSRVIPNLSMSKCAECDGTGRVGGLAKALFDAHPIERVVLTDKRPRFDGRERTRYHFHRMIDHYSGPIPADELPPEIYDLMTGRELRGTFGWKGGDSEASVIDAVSVAATNYGRALAHLPHIPAQV